MGTEELLKLMTAAWGCMAVVAIILVTAAVTAWIVTAVMACGG